MLNEVLKQIQYFLKCNVKRACICHLILVGILFILILPVKNSGWVLRRGGGGGDQPTKSAKCNESYFSTVSKASWLILLSKK